MEDVRYSEDVKEVIMLAGRVARKDRRTTVNDRDYWLGLLRIRRRFNRLDALLRKMDVSDNHMKLPPRILHDSPPAPTTDLLKNAEIIAKGSRENSAAHTTVEMEHLLKAFCMSSDPAVSTTVREARISPERIDQAAGMLCRGSSVRSVLYYAKELLEVVVFVLFFLILIRSFVGEMRLIPSESMVPGLQIDDRLVIERLTFPFRSFHRGDIMVFYPPMTELKTDPWSVFLRLTGFSGLMYKKEDNIDVAFIKRLIGLPGDVVDVRPGVGVFVNGRKLDEPYVNDIADSCTLVVPRPYCGPIKVPPHQYYMMGDNRNSSQDSRYWGFAQEDRFIGRAIFRVWPPDRFGPLQEVSYPQSADEPQTSTSGVVVPGEAESASEKASSN